MKVYDQICRNVIWPLTEQYSRDARGRTTLPPGHMPTRNTLASFLMGMCPGGDVVRPPSIFLLYCAN